MKKFVLWPLIALILIWSALQYRPVTLHIRGTRAEDDLFIRMPLKDKKRLDYFFRDVCFLNAWAYTLMGSKPMSIHQYRKPWAAVRYFIQHPELKHFILNCFWPPNFREICLFFNPQQLKIKLGWETLNKYISYFPNSRFVLYSTHSQNKEIVGLILTDKTKLLKTINTYIEDFQTVLENERINPKELVDEEKLFRFLMSIKTDDLIGTLLGFGRENSRLFEKARKLDPQEWPLVSAWAEYEDDYLDMLNQKDRSFKPWDISELFYPPFACDPNSEETKKLKQTYLEEREKIVNYYKGKDVVEATLSLFNQ